MYQAGNDYIEKLNNPSVLYGLSGTVGTASFTKDNILTGSLRIYNDASSNDDVTLGGVYIGVMECTFLHNFNIPRNSWKGKEITVSQSGRIDIDQTVVILEDIPLGVFTVSDATWSQSGVVVTAYDHMAKFDKRFTFTDITTSTPYELLSFACGECGVVLGMTRAEIEALPNGDQVLQLTQAGDMETYRDLIHYTAQVLSGFATADRQGRLVIRRLTGNSVLSIPINRRFEDPLFSDYETLYAGISVVDIENSKTKYYGSQSEGGVINLGSNPLLQGVNQSLPLNILSEVQKIKYTPFECELPQIYALLDLGDVITLPAGLANGCTVCIMGYDYDFDQGLTIKGYGANPELASAKSKTDKNIVGLLDKVNADEFIVHHYINTTELTINNGNKLSIVEIAYGSKKDTTISFYAEIQLQVECVEDTANGIYDALATITYNNNGENLACEPSETYLDGSHILHLIQKIPVDGNVIGNLTVSLTASGGNFIIPAGACKAWLEGTGLVAEEQWDGILRMSDFWTSSALLEDIGVQYYGDGIQSGMYIPIGGSFDETMGDTLLGNDIDVYNYVESMEVEDE